MYDTTTVIDYVRKALPDFFGSDAELKAGIAFVKEPEKMTSGCAYTDLLKELSR